MLEHKRFTLSTVIVPKELEYVHRLCYNSTMLMKGANQMSINVEQIKSEYPLGTTDGLTYTVKPRA